MTKHSNKIIFNRSEKGIALVEVIAAMAIAIIVITSLVSLSIFSLRTSLRSKLLLEGSKIANREIELVRAHRDNNTWEQFISDVMSCGDSCSMSLDGSGVVYNSTVEGSGTESLIRYFIAKNPNGSLVSIDDDIVRISVSVTWTIGDETKGAYIYTDLSNWRAK